MRPHSQPGAVGGRGSLTPRLPECRPDDRQGDSHQIQLTHCPTPTPAPPHPPHRDTHDMGLSGEVRGNLWCQLPASA